MPERKQRIYVVTDSRHKTTRLIQATSPQAAVAYACNEVEAKLATQNDLYTYGMIGRKAVENVPEEPGPEPAQTVIPMTAAGNAYP